MTKTPTFSRDAVAAPHWLASQTGQTILAEGGSALEAMVAMAATVAVVYPHMNSLGGDGFWLIHEPGGRVRYIEACGPAGKLATMARYAGLGVESIPLRGPHAALTVPGAVGGWQLALRLAKARGGRLPLAVLTADAIRHGREGYPVSRSEARCQPKELDALKQAPGFSDTFLVDGKTPEAGTVRKVPVLAATLTQITDAGLDDFYRGDVAREMAADLQRIGSTVTRDDLTTYEATWREPLAVKLNGRTLYNSAPPTQGLASLLLLGIFDRLDVKTVETFEHLHGLIESAKRAYAIRDRVCTDFARLRHDPNHFLTPRVMAREASRIDMRRASDVPLKPDDGDTIWMGAIDADGLAVSYIQSIYWEYGSGCVLPTTGVLLQNRGVSFALDPQAVNPLEPGRRPFHTLNVPICVFDDGRVVTYGSMGGDAQPQFQAQVFTRALFGVDLADALDRPRFLFGQTWGAPSATVKVENRYDSALVRALTQAGHVVEVSDEPYADMFGHAGIMVRHPRGHIAAAHDPRSDGGAAGT